GSQRQTGPGPLALFDGPGLDMLELFAQLGFAGRKCIGQTPAKCLAGVESLARENHAERSFQSDNAWKPLGSTPAGQKAKFHLGQPKLGAKPVKNQPVIAGERKFQAAT